MALCRGKRKGILMNPDTNKLEGKVCQKVEGIHHNDFLADSRSVGHLSKGMKLPLTGMERPD